MSSTDINKFLAELDMTNTEQALYLCGLSYKEVSVKELIKDASVNRTTAYHALNTLLHKGFTRETKREGVLYYRMTPPDEIPKLLENKKARIESQKNKLKEIEHLFPLPSLGGAASSDIDKFEGVENVKLAIEKALYCKSRKWNIIAPKDNFFSQIDKDYSKYFMKARKEREIQSKTLWEPNSSSSTLSLQDTLMRKPRYLHKDFKGVFTSVVIMFDDKVLFIPPLKEQSAVLLTSPEICSTLNVIFDALWHNADKK